MGRFALITAGPRERKTVTLPFPGACFDSVTGIWTGRTDQLDVRALTPAEYDSVVAKARTFARERGLENPQDGDELYERGRMLHTLVLACVDKDSPKDATIPYFESVEEIHKSELLLPEVIGYLYAQQRTWQDELSPIRQDMSEEEYIRSIARVAGGDVDFFVGMRPGIQWSFVRTMANQLAELKKRESLSSSLPEEPPTETSSTP